MMFSISNYIILASSSIENCYNVEECTACQINNQTMCGTFNADLWFKANANVKCLCKCQRKGDYVSTVNGKVVCPISMLIDCSDDSPIDNCTLCEKGSPKKCGYCRNKDGETLIVETNTYDIKIQIINGLMNQINLDHLHQLQIWIKINLTLAKI